jgi:hypothetical protein
MIIIDPSRTNLFTFKLFDQATYGSLLYNACHSKHTFYTLNLCYIKLVIERLAAAGMYARRLHVRWLRTFAMNVSQVYERDDKPV